MDETKKTTDPIVSSPDVTASSITPTAAPVAETRAAASKKAPAAKKRGSTTSSKAAKSSSDGLKKLTEKMEKLRIEMNDVSTWTEMIATDISDFLAKAAPTSIPIAAAVAAAPAAEEKEESKLDVAIFDKILSSLVDIKGTSFATSSIVIDLYRPIVAIANDIGFIANMMVQDSELANARRQQEEENRREFMALLEKLTKRPPEEKKDKDKDEDGKLGLMGWVAGLLGAASGFIIGLAKELGSIFKNIIKMVKESKLGKAIGKFIDDLGKSFERAWSRIKALPRLIASKLPEMFSRLGQNIATAFDNFMKTGERMISRFRAYIRLISDNPVFKAIEKTVAKVGTLLSAAGNKITAAVTGVKNFFTFVADAFKPVKEAFASVVSKFNSVKNLVKGADAAGDSIGIIGKAVNTLKGIWGAITKPFKVFLQLGEALGSLAGKVFGFLGKLAAKLFLPLTILMGIWDFFKGFSEKEGSIGDKFKEGMVGLVNGLIGWLVDIPKSIISWIAGKLGFKEIEKELDMFNFKDFIREFINVGQEMFEGIFNFFMNTLPELVGKITDVIAGYFTSVWENFKGVFVGLKDMLLGKIDFVDFFKGIVAGLIKVLLAPVNSLGKLVGFDITNKALDMLGLGGEASATGGGSAIAAPTSSARTQAEAAALDRIDAYASTLKPTTALDKRLAMESITPMTNATGTVLNETSQSTQAMKDAASIANNTSVVDASSRTNVTNNNQSVTYGGGLSIPDRTGMIFKASPYGI